MGGDMDADLAPTSGSCSLAKGVTGVTGGAAVAMVVELDLDVVEEGARRPVRCE